MAARPKTPTQPTDHPRPRLKKKPQSQHKWVCLDPDLTNRVEELERQERDLSRRVQTEPHLRERYDALIVELDDARDDARAASTKFVAISIGSKPWEDLVAKYPPTKEQKREVAKEAGLMILQFNPDTFPPVAMKACLNVSVGVDDDGADILDPLDDDEIYDINNGKDWNAGEVTELFGLCIAANQKVSRVADLGNG